MANYLDEEGLREYNRLLQMKFVASGGSSGTGTNLMPGENIDITDATATASQILDDATAYVKGVKVTGSMPNNGSTSKTIDGLTSTSATIPAGYTSGGTVSLTSDIEDALKGI